MQFFTLFQIWMKSIPLTCLYRKYNAEAPVQFAVSQLAYQTDWKQREIATPKLILNL